MKTLMFFLTALICNGMLNASQVDIVVFSYDRPMQLYAFLESLYLHSSNISETRVIYRCSNVEYREAYKQVFYQFPQIKNTEQINPPHDFKSLVISNAFQPGSAAYIVFAVDDIIVTDSINFDECTQAMESENAYGFYLRLGQNIDDCWSSNQFEGTPPLTGVTNAIYSWQFKTGIGGWAYPNSVDMTIYKKKDIEAHCRDALFFNPNTFEAYFGITNLEWTGLCYATSRVVNIPLNIVSTTTSTQHLSISAKELLDKFNDGLKIDTSLLFQLEHRSPHVFTYYPTYVLRERVEPPRYAPLLTN